MHYFNEFDPNAAAWLKQLMNDGLIPQGQVDDRDIREVRADDLKGYSRHHFFAGIGGFALALRLAGVSDDEPGIVTGSCPCQPWSNANVWQGGGRGHDDSRHLWPEFFRLIVQLRPCEVLGEQVPGAIAKGWLDGVFGDMESEGYTCGAVVFPACVVGARHQRQRLYWGAHSSRAGRQRHQSVAGFPVATETPFTFDGDPLARAWSALDGRADGLLHCDGLPLQVARIALHGFGNAIVPEQAAEFIKAFQEATAAS